MTAPYDVQDGDIVMSTFRCVHRKYLMAPTDPEIRQIVGYCFAYYVREHKITAHAAAALSTHGHDVFTDNESNRGAFLRDYHGKVACCLKAKRKMGLQPFRKGTSQVKLETTTAVADKMAYVMANPSAAGAVRYSEDWPGFISTVSQLGRTIRIKKPKYYFKDKKFPEYIDLTFELPQCLIDDIGPNGKPRGIKGAKRYLSNLIKTKEKAAHDEMRKKSWRYSGPDRCAKVNPFKEAVAYELWGSTNPRFSTLGGGKQAYDAAVEKLQAFALAYRAALKQWRDGNREVEFPHGTYKMRVLHNVRCAPPP